ncbi:photosystem II reaction center PsbP [Myxosarcina sp. GI1]|uniref:photosystem II reaction center PsbP n=1 Tax=Myxosarcina sp. GI1 TaxID=1541065 RepID=UPI00055D2C0C|nr:photosystem II reaction center PsbP [Myxosarcina sp. GI1]
MFKSIVASLVMAIALLLTSCATGVSGLQSYVNTAKGYEFLYPNGWIAVNIPKNSEGEGVDVVFRDLVERTENLSVIVSSVPEDKSLKDLGSPTDVGYRFLKLINDNPNSEREAEFIRAESREGTDKTYYLLEYEVDLPDQSSRHNIASVAVSRGKLFTFNLSTPEERWDKVKDSFEIAAKSFSVR